MSLLTPCAYWFTGLSSSGKTTIALETSKILIELGYKVKILDGDILRSGINSDLNFSTKDRQENIRRAAEITRLFLDEGYITLNTFITPTEELRQLAQNIIGNNRFKLVYISASLDICENRDVKGLYKLARQGKIDQFTGVSSQFELPNKFDLKINTESDCCEDSAQTLVSYILKTENNNSDE